MTEDKNTNPIEDQDRVTKIENQTNNNCQQFFGPVSGCVFAMPGSHVTQTTSPTPSSSPNSPIASSPSFDQYLTVAYRDKRKGDYENMLSVIRQSSWSDKDRARFALAVYNANILVPRTRPQNFSDWYQIFCDLFGFTYHKDYEPGKLTPNEATRQIELYL